MIKIEIKKENENIKNITIKGHSDYSEFGSDIVCASVSSISITTINAILKFSKESIKVEKNEGYLSINILNNSKEVNLLLENMIESLEDVEKQYEKYVKIYK